MKKRTNAQWQFFSPLVSKTKKQSKAKEEEELFCRMEVEAHLLQTSFLGCQPFPKSSTDMYFKRFTKFPKKSYLAIRLVILYLRCTTIMKKH